MNPNTRWLVRAGFAIIFGGLVFFTLAFTTYAGLLHRADTHGKGAVVEWDSATPRALGGRDAPGFISKALSTTEAIALSR